MFLVAAVLLLTAATTSNEERFIRSWSELFQVLAGGKRDDAFEDKLVELAELKTAKGFQPIKLFMLRLIFAKDLAHQIKPFNRFASDTIEDYILAQLVLMNSYLKGLQDGMQGK